MAFFVSSAHCGQMPVPLHARAITRPETIPPQVVGFIDPFEYLSKEPTPLTTSAVQAVASVDDKKSEELTSLWPRKPTLVLCPVRGFTVNAAASLVDCIGGVETNATASQRKEAYRSVWSRPKDTTFVSIGQSNRVSVAKQQASALRISAGRR